MEGLVAFVGRHRPLVQCMEALAAFLVNFFKVVFSFPPAEWMECLRREPVEPASQTVLPDELLEDIFLRLDAPDDLVRASAACTTFRRVVSARRFLRRFRSLHPPPALGFLEFDAPGTFRPAEPPHRSAPAARALAQAADFTFSFLPRALPGALDDWRVRDARDGRVLLYRRLNSFLTFAVADLVVCDPLHRQYVQLPPIPDDLAATTEAWGSLEFYPSLDPATDREKEEQDLPFRVICAVQCQHKLLIFHFSSATRKWRRIKFDESITLNQHAHSCFCWRFLGIGSLFILNTREMKFSALIPLPGRIAYPQAHGIVEVGEGRLGIVNVADGILVFYSKPWGKKNDGVDPEEWKYDKMIPLPQVDCCWRILSTVEGYLFLRATPPKPSHYHFAPLESQYFTLDLKTLLIERLCVSNNWSKGALLYASFPPSLSLPSI